MLNFKKNGLSVSAPFSRNPFAKPIPTIPNPQLLATLIAPTLRSLEDLHPGALDGSALQEPGGGWPQNRMVSAC